METVILILLLVGGGFLLYHFHLRDRDRAFVQSILDKYNQYPFKNDQAFKDHIAGKIPANIVEGARQEITNALFDFFKKYSLTDIKHPTVQDILIKFPTLDRHSVDQRVTTYGEWGRFELKAELFARPELWQLVDTIIEDVIKAAVALMPKEQALLVLPRNPLALSNAMKDYKGADALYHQLRIDADIARLIVGGPPFVFQQMIDRIAATCAQVAVPEDMWFEHAFLFAPTGTGKTNALSHFINYRLDQVAQGGASVVVMESNRDLVMSIARLKRFAPGGDLHGRLILVDFEDVEHPIGMNPWALPEDSDLSPAARESLYVSTIWSLEYLYRSLLDIELTPRQATLLRYATNLLIATPRANLDSLHRLMQPGGLAEFADYLPETDVDTRQFFATQYANKDDPHIGKTKQEIVARIATIKTIPAIKRILNAPRTTLDLDKELAKGRVILINASQQQLSPDGVTIIGRFFLGALVRAMHRRALLGRDKRLDTYIFLDECQDFVKNDPSIETLLDQARKYRLSLTLASQRPEQLGDTTLHALFGNAAIKMAAHLSDSAASSLAKNMDSASEFIRRPPPYSFAAYVRRVTDTAVYFQAPPFDFDKQPKMTGDEERAIRADMRARFAVPSRPEPLTAQDAETNYDNTKAADW